MPSFAIIAIYGIILERASCTSFHESLTSTGTGAYKWGYDSMSGDLG